MHLRKWLIVVALVVTVLGSNAVIAATRNLNACTRLVDYRNPECIGQVDHLAVAADPEATQDVAAPTTTVVDVVTDIELVPNETLALNFFFDPGSISVQRGHRVRWVQVGPLEDPHTVTIVQQADLPQTLEELDACFAEGAACSAALAAHDPDNDPQTPPVLRVNGGRPGLDQPGDSLFLAPAVGTQISAAITAPADTTLYYLCALHPWMQGEIIVQ